MGIIEFAIVTLKPEVPSPNDAGLHKVLAECIQSIHQAKGGTTFEFRKALHNTSDLCFLGGWATVEDHSNFLLSGESKRLLGGLKDYIDVKNVYHVFQDIEKVDTEAKELYISIYTVRGDRTAFEQRVSQNGKIVGGWKAKEADRPQFGEALKFVKRNLGSEQLPVNSREEEEQKEEEEVNVWVSFSTPTGYRDVEEFEKQNNAAILHVELVKFAKF